VVNDKKVDMRSELLDKESPFFKRYPNISRFLIEDVFDDIDGTNIKFDCIDDENCDVQIRFTRPNGVDEIYWCPVNEINGCFLPEKMEFGVEYKWVEFKMFESEDALDKIYSGRNKLKI